MQVTEKFSPPIPSAYLQSTPSMNISAAQLSLALSFSEITSIQAPQRIKHVFIFLHQQQTKCPP